VLLSIWVPQAVHDAFIAAVQDALNKHEGRKMEGKYLNNWSDFESMISDFSEYGPDYSTEINPDTEGVEVLLASYGTPSYEGYAFVLFRKDGKLYEVNASHCSCYGLEGQWSPEETTVESLRHRLDAGSLGSDDYTENVFADDLRAVLAEMATP
jgi:hypothetical protein